MIRNPHRTLRNTSNRHSPTPSGLVAKLSVREWILTDYYSTLTGEVSHALDQLHNATNWGLTLITGGLIAVISRSHFPDATSLYTLLILLVVTTHFSFRGMKGYINVIRFGLLQRRIAASAITPTRQASDCSASTLEELIRKYHVDWNLPLKRRDVYLKGILELGYGYMIIIITGLAIYAGVSISWRAIDWLAMALTLMLLVLEITIFARSPYMRNPLPTDDARIQRLFHCPFPYDSRDKF